jgi:hypothetical protein
MRAFRRLRALRAADRRLLLEASSLLAVVRVGLWLLPFATVRRVARALGRSGPRATAAGGPDEARVVWAIGVAGRAVPRSTCLVRALAGQALLARHGWPSELRLGVARGPDGAFRGHAWLEREGRVLMGGVVTERYVTLASFESDS